MKKDYYVYQSILKSNGENIEVSFPDLEGCVTFGNDVEEAILNAQEALEGYLFTLEELGEQIPEPSKLGSLKLKENETTYLVSVWMPLIRDQEQNKAIKKTLTLPKWLNDLAMEKGINFSHILQVGLKKALGIKTN